MGPRPKILIICDYYLPGFESGGAARTLANMVDRLGERYDFRIITRDRDGVAVKEPYTSVEIGAWNELGNASVYYLPPGEIRPGRLRELVDLVDPDAVYANSFFSRLTMMHIVLRRLGRVRKAPLIIAPEGEFSPGALSLGKAKKEIYIRAVKTLGLTNGAVWKAAGEPERDFIKRIIGPQTEPIVAPNMPPRTIFPEFDASLIKLKEAGEARIVFLSRFMRMKNFNFLLPILKDVKGKLKIDIWGTLEESDYWSEAQRLARALPPEISIESKGPVRHESVQETLFGYDFFVLPTLGESFGHVFIEAFSSGLPVIASDRSPWRGLREKGVGWDLSLDEPAAWRAAIQIAVDMDGDEHSAMRRRARAFATDWLSNPEIERSNQSVLEAALNR